jgi:micrococcal nuclease
MRRLSAVILLVAVLVLSAALARGGKAQTEGPERERLPEGVTEATVANLVDGDTLDVEIDGDEVTVRLIGMNTPETVAPNEPVGCFGPEASDRTGAMLPVGRTVWLEADVTDTDRFDRLLRHVWVTEGDEPDGAAFLSGEVLVREGYAQISTFPPDVKYVERFEAAQDAAVATNAGLWAACDDSEGEDGAEPTTRPQGVTTETPVPDPTAEPAAELITDCSAFSSFDEAQSYYAVNPAAQPNLDPNADGRACEVYFGVDAPVEAAEDSAAAAPAPSTGGGCDPSYPGVCIPPAPPDLDCGEVGLVGFQVVPPDPHGFDRDRDGVGCEG